MAKGNGGVSLSEIKAALNNAGDPWEAGVTSLSVLSREEQILHLGVAPPPGALQIEDVEAEIEGHQDEIRAEVRASATALPSSIDLRNLGGKNFITAIRNQGSCGSCVAFGSIAAVEGRARRQRNDPNLTIDLSEAHLFYCHAKARGRNCNTGWWPNEAFEDMQKKGVVDEGCFPYQTTKQDCTGLCANAASRLLKIDGYTELTKKPADIKQWLVDKGPVGACFIVYQDFMNYKSGVYKHVSGGQLGGHCVTIIGYNDDPGYWICKNSWGTGWGEQGFFKIGYGQCGIETWQNHGVNGIAATGWHNDVRVNGLWAVNQDRNAYAHVNGLGWRKVSPDNDNIFLDMLSQLAAAKAANRPVRLYEENSVIKQVYVF